MNEIRFGDAGPCRVFQPMIDVYRLDEREAAWTLVALCEGHHPRLLLTGTVNLPVVQNGDPLRCTFVDAPNPIVLNGELGALVVRSSALRLFGREAGLVVIDGSVETEWSAKAPAARVARCVFSITVALEAKLRI